MSKRWRLQRVTLELGQKVMVAYYPIDSAGDKLDILIPHPHVAVSGRRVVWTTVCGKEIEVVAKELGSSIISIHAKGLRPTRFRVTVMPTPKRKRNS